MSGVVDFSEDQLNDALYHAVDITDRCLLPFMLMGQTARSIIDSHASSIDGDGIYLGTRQANVTAEVISTLRTIAKGSDHNLGVKDFVEDDKGFHWVYRGIPIHIYVIKRNYKFLENPNFTWYRAEEYKIPNPFEGYWKARFLVK